MEMCERSVVAHGAKVRAADAALGGVNSHVLRAGNTPAGRSELGLS